ncbi:hypothetical protein GCM10008090_28200 [Arenicella chitinivorans]|uniref:Co-chaperone DjlA N-terminal domain-containing protein n=1 Tax=Arenicella chitinivorans TaxID=1329800 RepID=A0A918RZS0_9GAMM|nr:TerB family tellurite resistance protein [Arenicella chitinivorans]GHA16890.1 hypothetical protein GCM10008090_28200 [Arenicella chitinivorans]
MTTLEAVTTQIKRSLAVSCNLDIQTAAVTLMLKVIEADGHIDELELASLVTILRTKFGLDANEIHTLLARARRMSQRAKSLRALAYSLSVKISEQDRIRIFEYFWQLAAADRRIDDDERVMINTIASGFEIAPAELARAQSNAELTLANLRDNAAN